MGKNVCGNIALHLSAKIRRQEIVEKLIAKGADVLLRNSDGRLPRDLATNIEIKQLLQTAEEKQQQKGIVSSVLDQAVAAAQPSL